MPQGAHLDLPHMQWMFYLPRICNHCTYPACLSACPRQVIYKRQEDGIVLLDQSRCRGYRECVRGCPYKKVYFNTQTRVSEKCIGCYPAVEGGRQTQCTTTCIGKIRIQGFLSQPDRANPDNPLDYLVFVKKLALPLYPQFGLEPNTYYIPPIHVPPAYLRQMFGWGVEQAIATYRTAREDTEAPGRPHALRRHARDLPLLPGGRRLGHRLRRQAVRDRPGAAQGAGRGPRAVRHQAQGLPDEHHIGE